MILYFIEWRITFKDDFGNYTNWDRNLKDSYERALDSVKYFDGDAEIIKSEYSVQYQVEVPDDFDWKNVTKEKPWPYKEYFDPSYKLYTGKEEIKPVPELKMIRRKKPVD